MAVAVGSQVLIHPQNSLATNIMPFGPSPISISSNVPDASATLVRGGLHEQRHTSNGNSPVSSAVSSRKRRLSKGKVLPGLKKSSSTPHIRSLAIGDAPALSPTAEKKRSKLGYHRTSVACGHCRRRKIRCLSAQDDPAGRCSNCIRLKKECNFYPVEQQLPTEGKSKGDFNSNTPSISARSSPQSATGPLACTPMENFSDYQASSGVGQIYTGSSDASLAHHLPYTHDVNGTNWAYPRHHSIAGETIPEAPSSAFWRLNESNNVPPYQMVPAPPDNPGAIAPSVNGFSDGYPMAEPAVYGPMGGHPHHPHHHHHHHHHNGQAPFSPSDDRQRFPVPTYPPTLDTSIAFSMPLQSVSDAPSGSMSAPIIQPMAHSGGYPQSTSYSLQSPSSYISTTHAIPNKWLQDSTHLGRVEEEMQSATAFGQYYS